MIRLFKLKLWICLYVCNLVGKLDKVKDVVEENLIWCNYLLVESVIDYWFFLLLMNYFVFIRSLVVCVVDELYIVEIWIGLRWEV